MAASRTTVLLLGLVVLATMGAGAEAIKVPNAHTCERCPSDFKGLLDASLKVDIDLEVDLTLCPLLLEVLVGGVEPRSNRGKALKVIVGGKMTKLGPLLQVRLKALGVLGVGVQLLAKNGKTVVAKVALDIRVADAAVALVDGRYLLRIEVVLDPRSGELLFFTGNVRLCILDIRAYIHLLGLVSIGADLRPVNVIGEDAGTAP